MTITDNNGGPVFPSWPKDGKLVIDENKNITPIYEGGMTLRDYLAAKAMQALLSKPDCPASAEDLAAYAYGNADAMLAERAKGNDK